MNLACNRQPRSQYAVLPKFRETISSKPSTPTLGQGIKDTPLKKYRYGPRTLREGYVYVLLDQKIWHGYEVTEQGHLRQFDPFILPRLCELARHKESAVVEGHLMPDHVYICLSISPKYAVSNVVGYIKGKSAITIARQFGGRARNFTGEVYWARGYFVSTVGLDEEMVKAYIRNQEEPDERYDQMKLPM